MKASDEQLDKVELKLEEPTASTKLDMESAQVVQLSEEDVSLAQKTNESIEKQFHEEMHHWQADDDSELNELAKSKIDSQNKTEKGHGKTEGTLFCSSRSRDRITLFAIILFACWLIPLAWIKSQDIVAGLFQVIGGFLSSSSAIFFVALGWNIIAYPISSIFTLSLLLNWINRFSQASKVDLLTEGIVVSWPSQLRKLLKWNDITSVFLFRPHETMLPEKWLVGFGTSSTQPVNLRLPVMSKRGQELLKLLKANCPWVSVDPALIEFWEPAIADSHTELWLKSLSSAPKEAELLPLFPGDFLNHGRYQIIRRIGVGGQGTAYLVKDQTTDKDVVVKETLFPVFVDSDARQQAQDRFNHEISLLTQLDNDNVIKMLDSFSDAHRGYLVLDYIDGESLRQLVKRQGPLSQEKVIDLAVKMAKILSYLHGLEPPVVHRDFTPDNLMLDTNGKLVLIDFNVAKKMESNKTATVVGKHAYIPPEQFRSEADPRSDIYACGATLHFLLIGEDPEPISQSHPALIDQNISPLLNDLVSKCTAQESSERFQTAEEILLQLEAARGSANSTHELSSKDLLFDNDTSMAEPASEKKATKSQPAEATQDHDPSSN